MSDSSLRVVDRETRTRVLFDLTDLLAENTSEYGGVTTELLGDPDWGAPRYDRRRFKPTSRDGIRTTYVSAVDREVTLKVRFTAPDYDSLALGVGRLSRYLQAGCTLEWTPAGSAYTRYLDVEPSDSPALLDGRELGLFEVLRLFQTNSGVTLKLICQPYFEGAELDPETNLLPNSTLLLDFDTTDTEPDSWAWGAEVPATGGIDPDEEAFSAEIDGDTDAELSARSAAASVTTDESYVFAFDVKVAGGTTAYAQAGLEFYDSGDVIVGSRAEGELTQLTTQWQRIYVAAVASDGDEDYVWAYLMFSNTDSSPVTVFARNAQLENDTAPTLFVTAPQDIYSDPAFSGRIAPLFIHGDVPTPIRPTVASGASEEQFCWIASLGRDYTGQGSLTTYVNAAKVAQAEDGTNGTDTADATVAEASPQTGTSAARTTFSTTTMEPRVTWDLTDNLAGLQGREWLLIARVKPGASNVHSLRIDVGWGGAYDAPASAFVATFTGSTSGDWCEVPCGIVGFPNSLAAGLHIVANATGDAADVLDWDCLLFVPTNAGLLDLGQEIDGYSFHADPEELLIGAVDDEGAVVLDAGTSIEGPVPSVVRPEFNAVYIAALESTDGTRGTSDITSVWRFKAPYRPRYFA